MPETAPFSDILAARLRQDPGSPLVTFYDDATGERTELSAVTWANWIAKTANVLTEDLDLMAGEALAIDLPPHWLGTVFFGAACSVGLTVSDDADITVGGPQSQADLICSLHPFALPLTGTQLPPGSQDFGHLWPGQPDVLLVPEPAPVTFERSAERVITDINPLQRPALLLDALAGTGSLVLVANPDRARWPARTRDERATLELLAR